jgi:hypothetical protein
MKKRSVKTATSKRPLRKRSSAKPTPAEISAEDLVGSCIRRLRELGLDPVAVLFRAIWGEQEAIQVFAGRQAKPVGSLEAPGQPLLLREAPPLRDILNAKRSEYLAQGPPRPPEAATSFDLATLISASPYLLESPSVRQEIYRHTEFNVTGNRDALKRLGLALASHTSSGLPSPATARMRAAGLNIDRLMEDGIPEEAAVEITRRTTHWTSTKPPSAAAIRMARSRRAEKLGRRKTAPHTRGRNRRFGLS